MNIAKIPNINHLWSSLLIEELVRNGVTRFCISPGSRSTPLTMAVAQNREAESFIHFDERASAFRALGMVAATKKPCAVITTSGTAAANLLPAIIEASKKKLPLIIFTADRPPELRQTGAHQTIDQTKLYGEYVRWFFDLPCPTLEIPPEFVLTSVDQAIARAQGNPAGPVHINCMYREPLVPVSATTDFKPYTRSIQDWSDYTDAYTQYVKAEPSLSASNIKSIALKIQQIKSGIIVVGKLAGKKEQTAVIKLSEQLQWPIVPDISSGLRLGTTHPNVIHYFDQILLSESWRKHYQPDGVLHLGGRITSKRWYEYIQKINLKHYIMVLSHPLRNDPLHNVFLRVQCPVGDFCARLSKVIEPQRENRLLKYLQGLNANTGLAIDEVLSREAALTEPHVARLISHHIPKKTGLFAASSMPIRDLDMYGWAADRDIAFGANRGASGIDGLIATAAGFSTGLNRPTTLVIGDLAFLYDLNALAMLRDLKHPLVIVVVNNNGGGIFSFLPVEKFHEGFEKYFGTPHGLSFHAAADLFDLNYARPETVEEFTKTYTIALKSTVSTIIEISSDRAYNLAVHQRLQKHIQTRIDTLTN